ncbi:MAG: hypothetical protein JSV03_12415 [Planctomycetota bacterium]|nr:MAG: hypothetical protein JSV03_12415 [Planctomycetota bacterium]
MKLGVVCSLGLLLNACMLGPTAIRVGHVKYNEAVQTTTMEQLLLNLVRLKYRQPPAFLELENVSAQFQFDQSADLEGRINEGPTRFGPDSLSVSSGISYAERPTLTYTPLKGDEFVRRMLSPLNLETIALLSQSAWSIDRVMRLTIQEINGLDNASSASGPTPSMAPPFEDFARFSELLRELQIQGLVDIVYVTRPKELSDAIPSEAVDGQAVVKAAEQGYSFRSTKKGYILAEETRSPVLRISPKAVDSQEVRELLDLLGLKVGKSTYDITVSISDHAKPDESASYDNLIISTRSLLGTLFYISQAVEVPMLHRKFGLVRITRDELGEPFDWSRITGDLIRIHSQMVPPVNAAVAVRYKEHWFYISESDLESKATFSLLVQLFELQAGKEAGAAPVLTLPIGG